MTPSQTFQQQIQAAYQSLLASHEHAVPEQERVKIDLHCHDHNSDVTDELLGRILRFPETWLKTEELVHVLKRNRCNAITITNHNNARSCWQLLDQGEDVLVGAEFSCLFEEYDVNLHVLAYGFTPDQEVKLNKHRNNLYRFLTYAVENDIPTVLPHPLYFDTSKVKSNPEIFEKLALMFERFEVVNGQRDVWQNLLTWEWLNAADEEKLEAWQKKHRINSGNFCKNVVTKTFTGGSDDHMGMFAGTCGSYLHVPALQEKLKTRRMSELVLEAIKEGRLHPFGSVSNHEKLNVAFIDYLSQVALHMKEPGLLRMFLHKGTLQDKLICLGFSNAMQELRRHRFTMFFFKTLHEAFKGKRPSFLTRLKITPDFKPLVRKIDEIAKSRHRDQERYLELLKEGSAEMFTTLNHIIAKRIKIKAAQANQKDLKLKLDTASLIKQFEIPTHFRALFEDIMDKSGDDVSQVNISDFLDTLSFPVLASSIIAGASMISTRVLNNQRDFINGFAQSIGRHVHPERALWLTDTLKDKNGVSNSLSRRLELIQEYHLDVDFLICHESVEEQPHLKVVRPISTFSIPNYPEQAVRVPDILEIQRVFIEGGYDRIICSTELLMGLVALFLKQSMAVPAYFFMHTDWLEFFNKTTSLEPPVIDRIRRTLRAFYLQFDGMFVMNQDHQNWLTGPAIKFDPSRVFMTANWVDQQFYPREIHRATYFNGAVSDNDVVLLYAGRLSDEKGVFDLAEAYQSVKKRNANVKLVFAGVGPAEERLKEQLPEAIFLGWVDRENMPDLYSQVDLLVLPSRFDTFGNVILEAMNCGSSVAAYAVKGPKSIIKSQKFGILAQDVGDLTQRIEQFIKDPTYRQTLRTSSLKRAKEFRPELLMETLMRNVGLNASADSLTIDKTPEKARQIPAATTPELKKAIGY